MHLCFVHERTKFEIHFCRFGLSLGTIVGVLAWQLVEVLFFQPLVAIIYVAALLCLIGALLGIDVSQVGKPLLGLQFPRVARAPRFCADAS